MAASFSPSISPSRSPSISPSQSPSASLSPSSSPSISPSYSPSPSPGINLIRDSEQKQWNTFTSKPGSEQEAVNAYKGFTPYTGRSLQEALEDVNYGYFTGKSEQELLFELLQAPLASAGYVLERPHTRHSVQEMLHIAEHYGITIADILPASHSPSPSISPSRSPSKSPSVSPSFSPSISPSRSPSLSPSISPSVSPSGA